MNLVADYTKENLIVFLVIIVFIGIILTIIGKLKSSLTADSVTEYNHALNKINKLKESKRKFTIIKKSLFVAAIIIAIAMYFVPIITYRIEVNSLRGTGTYAVGRIVNIDKPLFFIKIAIIVIHIIWVIFEKIIVRNKILKDNNLNEQEKNLLCKGFITPITTIMGSCLLCEVIPLIIKIIEESNIMY